MTQQSTSVHAGFPDQSALPDRNNSYSFDDFLARVRRLDFYLDDPFLQKLVNRYCVDELPELGHKLTAFSQKASYRWRDLADRIADPDLRPRLVQLDAHNHRVDRIVRPEQAEILERESFGQGLFSGATSYWEGFIKRFIHHQIGEACVMCPIACTEGLVALIEAFPNDCTRAVAGILEHCKEGIDGDFGIGAQFMTEIQGGSDIPANALEAEPDGEYYRLYGTKFFC